MKLTIKLIRELGNYYVREWNAEFNKHFGHKARLTLRKEGGKWIWAVQFCRYEPLLAFFESAPKYVKDYKDIESFTKALQESLTWLTDRCYRFL